MSNRYSSKLIRRRTGSFGGCTVARCSPAWKQGSPPMINCAISFEEALKLHLSLGQLLGYLNGLDRREKKGRQRGLRLCIKHKGSRVIIFDEGNAERPGRPEPQAEDDGE